MPTSPAPILRRVRRIAGAGPERRHPRARKKPQSKREYEERELRERRARIADRKSELVETCRIPDRFWDFTLEGSPLAQTSSDLVERMIAEADGDEDDTGSWFLWGEPGRGKTGLALAYARRVMRLDDPDAYPMSVLYWPVSEFFTALKAAYHRATEETEYSLLERCKDVSLLILDDLGTERPTEWTTEKLYEVINYRHGAEAATIFTSNFAIPDLQARIGERTCWRLIEMCGDDHIVHVEGANLRDVKRPSLKVVTA